MTTLFHYKHLDCINTQMFMIIINYLLVLPGRSIPFTLISCLTNALLTRAAPIPACVIQVSEVILAQEERLQIGWRLIENEGLISNNHHAQGKARKPTLFCKNGVFVVIVAPMMQEKHQMNWCCLIYFGNAFDDCTLVKSHAMWPTLSVE